jgi:hypothetical protein
MATKDKVPTRILRRLTNGDCLTLRRHQRDKLGGAKEPFYCLLKDPEDRFTKGKVYSIRGIVSLLGAYRSREFCILPEDSENLELDLLKYWAETSDAQEAWKGNWTLGKSKVEHEGKLSKAYRREMQGK